MGQFVFGIHQVNWKLGKGRKYILVKYIKKEKSGDSKCKNKFLYHPSDYALDPFLMCKFYNRL